MRERIIDKEEAMRLVDKFDRHSPTKESTEIFMKYCSVDKEILQKAVDRWTNKRIWSQRNDFI